MQDSFYPPFDVDIFKSSNQIQFCFLCCHFLFLCHTFIFGGQFPLLIVYFCRMPCGFITGRHGDSTTTCFAVCVCMDWRTHAQWLIANTPGKQRCDWSADHKVHLLFTWWFVDWRASSKVCTLRNYSQLGYHGVMGWIVSPHQFCIVEVPTPRTPQNMTIWRQSL